MNYDARGCVTVNENFMTNLDGVFAGGDTKRGASSSSGLIAEGRRWRRGSISICKRTSLRIRFQCLLYFFLRQIAAPRPGHAPHLPPTSRLPCARALSTINNQHHQHQICYPAYRPSSLCPSALPSPNSETEMQKKNIEIWGRDKRNQAANGSVGFLLNEAIRELLIPTHLIELSQKWAGVSIRYRSISEIAAVRHLVPASIVVIIFRLRETRRTFIEGWLIKPTID